MLLITRKRNESIRIGDETLITVRRIDGKVVSFGIRAPRQIRVDREEVWRRRQLETQQPEESPEG